MTDDPFEPSPSPAQVLTVALAALIFAVDVNMHGVGEDSHKFACDKAEEFVGYARVRYPEMFADA